MSRNFRHFSDVFDQLGLPSDDESMEQFICTHRPLPSDMELADAPFWSESQASFLRQKLAEDNEWSLKVDGLNAALHDAGPY